MGRAGRAANGEGSVTVRGQSWQVRWHNPATGRRLSRTFPTLDEAQHWLDTQRAAILAEAPPELPPIPADQRRVANNWRDLPPLRGWTGTGDWHWVRYETGRIAWEWRGRWDHVAGEGDPLHLCVTEAHQHVDWGEHYEGHPLLTEPDVIRALLAARRRTTQPDPTHT
jgi:hypothetical protein